MRNPKRIKRMLNLIEKLWNKFPDQRLGQLLMNYAFVEGKRGTTEDLASLMMYNQEDNVTEQLLRYNQKFQKKGRAQRNPKNLEK